MNCLNISNLSGRNDCGHIQVALTEPGRANTDSFVSKADVQCIAVGFTVNRDSTNAEFLARIQYAQSNFATIGNQNLTKHSYPLSEASSADSNSAELKRGAARIRWADRWKPGT